MTQTLADKAHFHGNYRFYSARDHGGGFELSGTLYDDDKSNSRGVKFQVRADGQHATVYKAVTDQDRSIPDRIYPPCDTTVVGRGFYQTCQVNYTKDDCTAWTSQINPYG